MIDSLISQNSKNNNNKNKSSNSNSKNVKNYFRLKLKKLIFEQNNETI